MMKVLHIVCTAPPYKGGMGNGALRIVDNLCQAGVSAALASPLYGRNEPAATARNIRLKPLFSIGNAAVLPELFRLVRKFDIIHLHYPFYGAHLLVWLACLAFRKPLVMQYHMDSEAPGIRGLAFRINRLFVEPLLLRRASVIIASSADYLEASQIAGYAKSRPDKLAVLPFGIDAARFAPIDGATKLPIVLFVGALDSAHYFKGVPVLIEAVALLKKQGRWPAGWSVRLVGDGNLRTAYQQTVADCGLADAFEFSGKLDDDRLLRAYQDASMLVLPSTTKGEAFGIVLLEAMGCGTPVIASRLPGVRSVFTDGVSGMSVVPNSADDLARALLRSVADGQWRTAAGAAARSEVLAKYLWPGITRRLIDIYSKLR